MTKILTLMMSVVGLCSLAYAFQQNARVNDLMHSVIQEEPCSLPCVYGIHIEQTTLTEAEDVLEIVWGKQSVSHPNEYSLLVCFGDTCSQSIGLSSHDPSQMIEVVRLLFRPGLFLCHSFVATYGVPDYFYNFPDVNSYVMFYSERQVEVIVVPERDHPNVSWIEAVWVRNASDFRERFEGLKQEQSSSLEEFSPDLHCPK